MARYYFKQTVRGLSYCHKKVTHGKMFVWESGRAEGEERECNPKLRESVIAS